MPPTPGDSAKAGNGLSQLLYEIRSCAVCAPHLPMGPNPVVRAQTSARILLVGQAPGTRVHATGIPWNDASGDKLREWLAVSRDEFYDENIFAIIPMGFCYPGRGKSGDLPPRRECAPLWHTKLRAMLPELRLVLLVGAYAIRYYLPRSSDISVRDLVFQTDFLHSAVLPLVHPSPRNRLWLKQNPWFEAEKVPQLALRIRQLLKAIA